MCGTQMDYEPPSSEVDFKDMPDTSFDEDDDEADEDGDAADNDADAEGDAEGDGG